MSKSGHESSSFSMLESGKLCQKLNLQVKEIVEPKIGEIVRFLMLTILNSPRK